jgi:hypothetical protein
VKTDWNWLFVECSPKYRFVAYAFRFAWCVTVAMVFVLFGEGSPFRGGGTLYVSAITCTIIGTCISALLNNSTRFAERVERLEQELKTFRGEQLAP